MSFPNSKSGFSAVELILIIAVVAVLGFAGYTIRNNQQTKSSGDSSQQDNAGPSKASGVSSAPAVTTVSDLDKASTTLDQNDPVTANASDSSQLDSDTGTF